MAITVSFMSESDRCDQVWLRIQHEAESIVCRDSVLGDFITRNVVGEDSLEAAICHRVASCLAHEDLRYDALSLLFKSVLEESPDMGLTFREDIIAAHDRDPACARYIEPLLYFKGFHAIQAHRFAHFLWAMGRRDVALYLQGRASQVFQVDVHPAVPFGRGVFFDHATGIVIGETGLIEDNVSILQGVTLGGTGKEEGDRHPKIRHGVLIGAGAKILGNIEVGRGARVAAGSVVLKDVPPNSTAVGVPARILKSDPRADVSLNMNQIPDGQIECEN